MKIKPFIVASIAGSLALSAFAQCGLPAAHVRHREATQRHAPDVRKAHGGVEEVKSQSGTRAQPYQSIDGQYRGG